MRKFLQSSVLRRPFDETQAGSAPAPSFPDFGELIPPVSPEQPATLETPRVGRLLRRREEVPHDPREHFQRCARTISDLMGIPVREQISQVLVFGPRPDALLELCARSGLYDAEDLGEIQRQLLAGESYFLPDLPAVFLANQTGFVAAEEASHFIRHVSGGSPDAASRSDLFYQLVMHEALGFFGSRLVVPERETPCEAEILAIGLYPAEDDEDFSEDELLVFEIAALHLQAERDEEHAPYLTEVYEAPIPAFVGAAHLLGYSLAHELHEAVARGDVAMEEIRALFFEDWGPEGAALRSYIDLRSRVGLSEESLALALEEYLD